MFAYRFLSPAVLLSTTGCLYTHRVLSIDPSFRAPTVPDSVRVLAQEPAQTYTVLAIATVATDVPGAGGYSRLMWQLVSKAAELGGNGVLLGSESLQGSGWSLTGRVIAFDSVAPPPPPAVRAPNNTWPTIAFVGMVALISLEGILKVASAGSPEE